MEDILSSIASQTLNYAIRSGIAITAHYAFKQCSRLVKIGETGHPNRLLELQNRLKGKVHIVSPAIDMIELISARGNTSLVSAVTLTKSIRRDLQKLGRRLANAANEEEIRRSNSAKAKSDSTLQSEIESIENDIETLLGRIEDAVPLINLAISMSGVKMTTHLPNTVSPSRLLQASTFMTAGDSQYSLYPGVPIQIGPVFTLSMYMLFAGHAYRPQDREEIRQTTWKQVIRKARLRLMRVPINRIHEMPRSDSLLSSHSGLNDRGEFIPADCESFEFAYQLVIIEDLDDGLVRDYDQEQHKPDSLLGVTYAGIRELLPIHQISKIFYADTGKLLNIDNAGEANSPVLLLKRDVTALLPRRMMRNDWMDQDLIEDGGLPGSNSPPNSETADEIQDQLRREFLDNTDQALEGGHPAEHRADRDKWKIPKDLDPEWIAFEVFTEEGDGTEYDETSTVMSEEPEQDGEGCNELGNKQASSDLDTSFAQAQTGQYLAYAFSFLNLGTGRARAESSSPCASPLNRSTLAPPLVAPSSVEHASSSRGKQQSPPTLPPLRTSLSLLEMMIRLSSLQQFQQQSHLSVSDEFLNFFLSQSSSVGLEGDAMLRQRIRRQARMRVGFDPYDESPVKLRSEDNIRRREEQMTMDLDMRARMEQEELAYEQNKDCSVSPSGSEEDADRVPRVKSSPLSRLQRRDPSRPQHHHYQPSRLHHHHRISGSPKSPIWSPHYQHLRMGLNSSPSAPPSARFKSDRGDRTPQPQTMPGSSPGPCPSVPGQKVRTPTISAAAPD